MLLDARNIPLEEPKTCYTNEKCAELAYIYVNDPPSLMCEFMLK